MENSFNTRHAAAKEREFRMPVVGITFVLQKNRLLLGEAAAPALGCKIRNSSPHGFCVVLDAPATLPPSFKPGLRMILENNAQEKTPVELRWVADNRAGLLRLPS